jgi:protein-histidine pros-kinase
MSLRLTFNLVLVLATAGGIALAGWFTQRFLQENAQQEVLDSARMMMQSAIAVRSYTIQELRPLLALQQKRQFLPQTVPAYAAHRYVGQLQKEYPDYSYREATLNPTNPADRAADWEADLVQWFRNHENETELIGKRETPTGPSLYLSRPIKVSDPKCLGCHSKPTEAPRTMIDSYGTANGFGWKLNEIVGAQIVSVPMSVPLERARETVAIFLAVLAGIFLLVGVLLNVMLHFIVIKPINRMARKANEISMGALDVPELEVKGGGEIAVLGQSFNRMYRSLTNAVNMLNESIDGGQPSRGDR